MDNQEQSWNKNTRTYRSDKPADMKSETYNSRSRRQWGKYAIIPSFISDFIPLNVVMIGESEEIMAI